MEQCSKQRSSSRIARALLLSLSILFACALNGYAQNIVKGVVTDVDGGPLPGVSILVKGTSTGATTDINGKYTINAPAQGTLVFSYIGMTKKEQAVKGRNVINVKMEEDAANLDEVVVVGYGTQKKAHLTGSVAAVSQKDMLKTTASNISQTLVGKLPGLVTQQSLGQPGSDNVTMHVRGYSSYNGSTPLTLVDGVERQMWQVDPNDVESVTILKDAASCAVYGMKASNGVILITTKKGKEGRPEITYRGSLTLSHATKLPKMMNGTQYMQWYNLALQMDGEDPYFTDEEIAQTYDGDLSNGIENTDWTSDLYKTTLMHQHNLSISGGTERTRYFVSGGFIHQNGFIKDHKNQRGNFRSNVDIKATDHIKVSLNLAGRVQDYYQPGAYSYENQKSYSIFHQLLYSLPFVTKEYNGEPASGYRSAANAANPIYGSQNSGFTKSRTTRIESSANIEYSFPFLKGLKANMFASWDWQDQDSKTFAYAYNVWAYSFSRYNANHENNKFTYVKSANLLEEGNLYVGNSKKQQVILRPSISYNQTFGKHNVGALFLYEQTRVDSHKLDGSRTNFDLFDLPELSLGDPTTATNSGSSGKSAYAAYVGRLNYAFANKYLLEASFRYDGSYLFAKDHRWGFFPSVSVGWVASEENFFKQALPKIDYFKVRGSVGVLGSDNVSAFLYRKSYSYSGNSVVFGSTPTINGTISNAVAYPMEDLTWEKTRTLNLGFDLSAWHGLLGVEFDVFYKYTYDILDAISGIYPPSLGGHVPTKMNTGTFDNRGFELVLKHRNHIGQFNYSLNGNLTYAHNRILKKTQSDNILPWQSVLGNAVGAQYGLVSDGLYQSEEEIANAPKPINVTPRVGDIKYVDINGDGKITSDDQVKIGRSSSPEMMFAFMADAEYKGIDLSIQFQGAALCDKMLQGSWYNLNSVTDANPLTAPWYANYDNSPLYLVENAWRPDNTDAEYPRLSVTKASYQNNAVISDFWKRNGAYLRLKNVTLGYTLPKAWAQKIGLNKLRVYANGTNLLTFTQFKYLDPESANVITGYYPQQRTFSFGLDVTF